MPEAAFKSDLKRFVETTRHVMNYKGRENPYCGLSSVDSILEIYEMSPMLY
jgi:hypothetical protein